MTVNGVKLLQLTHSLKLAREEQIVFIFNGSVSRIMCTPENLEELAIGFLISEGVVKNVKNARDLKNTRDAGNRIKVYAEGDVVVAEYDGEPVSFKMHSSGCAGIYIDDKELPSVEASERWTVEEIEEMLHLLETVEYRTTRGYHSAFIIGKDGVLARGIDVGRHNAVDKAIGAAFLKDVDFSRTYLLISGRISKGIALKCVRAGIPLVASKAAILDSAVEICKRSGLSAVSFASGVAVAGKAVEGI